MVIFPLLGLIIGVLLGFSSPFEFSQAYSLYVAIGILTCMDSVLGGVSAILNKNFDIHIFISGFFGNAFLSVILIWLGNQLNIQLSIAAIVVYGSRLFQNFANIRRFLLNKKENDDNIYI